MRSARWLFLLASACGGSAEPTVTTPPPLEQVAPEPPPLPPHDLAGAPAYESTHACTPGGTGPSGAELAEEVEAIRTGTPRTTVDHRVLLARCEIERPALAEAYLAGALEAWNGHRERLATTLLVQALHADPGHLPARVKLAIVLAATGRPLAALTHLRELRRGGDDGLAALRAVATDDRFTALHDETAAWLELFFPDAIDPEPAVLAPRGEPIDIRESFGQPEETAPVLEASYDWEQMERILAATPGVPAPPEGRRRVVGQAPYLRGRIPPVLTAHTAPPVGAARWLQPAPGAYYLLLTFADVDAAAQWDENPRAGYALYRVEDAQARLVRTRQVGDAECDHGDGEETWLELEDGELRELSLCGDRITMARLRHEDGALRLHEASFAREPHPAPLEAGAWVPRETATAAVEAVDGVPALAPARTCLPDDGAPLGGAALRARLEELAAGRDVEATVGALTASCTVDASDVADAFLGAARARSADAALARELLVRALGADPRNPGARYELVVQLAAAGSSEAALRQLEALAAAGEPARPFLRASAHDRRLTRLRSAAYGSLLVDFTRPNARAFQEAGVSLVPTEEGPEPIASRLRPPIFDGEGRIQPDRRAWTGGLALLRASMTPRPYRRRPAGTFAPDALPAHYRGEGFVRADQPTWWRPNADTTLLVVPYVHPEEGFHAVALYAPEEGGLRYAGRDRAYLRGCGDGPGVTTEIGFDETGSDLWLLVSCQWFTQLCRFTTEGGALVEVCTAERNEQTSTIEEP